MKLILKLPKILYNSVMDMINHDGIEHAGYLAFLLMLTIFPFLVFITALLGFFGSNELGALLVNLIINSPWANFIDALKPRILEITSAPPQSLLTIAILSAIWTASSIFDAIRTILNKAYRVKGAPSYFFRRLISIVEFLIVISLVIFLLLLLVVLPTANMFLIGLFEFKSATINNLIAPASEGLRIAILVMFAFLMIAMLFYKLPNTQIRFVSTLPGAALVMFCWYLATITFRYYLGHFHQLNFIYGSIAGVIVSLLYFYICSIILIVGAEFNYHLERRK